MSHQSDDLGRALEQAVAAIRKESPPRASLEKSLEAARALSVHAPRRRVINRSVLALVGLAATLFVGMMVLHPPRPRDGETRLARGEYGRDVEFGLETPSPRLFSRSSVEE